mmetsp:Transcript_45504/g.67055  ORF Transcript_45504/g.67055 Transcript_45504/m.67055 type:complete len:255 (+) Transcript_45504:137-901(+)
MYTSCIRRGEGMRYSEPIKSGTCTSPRSFVTKPKTPTSYHGVVWTNGRLIRRWHMWCQTTSTVLIKGWIRCYHPSIIIQPYKSLPSMEAGICMSYQDRMVPSMSFPPRTRVHRGATKKPFPSSKTPVRSCTKMEASLSTTVVIMPSYHLPPAPMSILGGKLVRIDTPSVPAISANVCSIIPERIRLCLEIIGGIIICCSMPYLIIAYRKSIKVVMRGVGMGFIGLPNHVLERLRQRSILHQIKRSIVNGGNVRR